MEMAKTFNGIANLVAVSFKMSSMPVQLFHWLIPFDIPPIDTGIILPMEDHRCTRPGADGRLAKALIARGRFAVDVFLSNFRL